MHTDMHAWLYITHPKQSKKEMLVRNLLSMMYLLICMAGGG
jgi:hypothetical protein